MYGNTRPKFYCVCITTLSARPSNVERDAALEALKRKVGKAFSKAHVVVDSMARNKVYTSYTHGFSLRYYSPSILDIANRT